MKEGGAGHEYGGKMTASQSEEMTEELLKRIEGKKRELENADLTTQVKLNKQIAALYKQFYNSGKKKLNCSNKNLNNSMLDQSLLQTGLKKMQSDHSMFEQNNVSQTFNPMFLSVRPQNPRKNSSMSKEENKNEGRQNVSLLKKYK